MPKKLTQAEFVDRAVAVHGVGRYDYSQTVYLPMQKVAIRCLEHGLFKQNGSSHLSGIGCPKCGRVRTTESAISNAESFIRKAEKVHGAGTYDYSQLVYSGNKIKVKIICPEHGLFEQKPNNHLYYGCNLCGFVKGSSQQLSNKVEFIQKAESIHGASRYDYTLVEYKKSSERVKILCPEHGAFEQVANLHLQGSGCPPCGFRERNRVNSMEWAGLANGRECTLYFIRLFDKEESFYKVGITFRSVAFRYRRRKSLGGYNYEIVGLYKSVNAKAVHEWEQSIIESFSHLRYNPKNPFDGQTECFSSCNEILAIFPL